MKSDTELDRKFPRIRVMSSGEGAVQAFDYLKRNRSASAGPQADRSEENDPSEGTSIW
jgi:hypothetical protein